MSQVTVRQSKNTSATEKKGMVERYLDYCDAQMQNKTLWYLIPLVFLSAAVMPIGIFLMSYFSWYMPFVTLSVLLFFANLVVNIAGMHTRVTISLFFITVLIHFLAPLLGFLIA